MNQKILEKQVTELIDFFEKYPQESKALSVSEYKSLLKGLVILITKSPESIDLTIIYNYFNVKVFIENKKLIKLIEQEISKTKSPVLVNYTDVLKILTVYKLCLNDKNNVGLEITEWLNLSGYTRALQMERLWFNVKK